MACDKKEAGGAAVPPAASVATPPPASAAPPAAPAPAPSTSAAATALTPIPESFETGAKVDIENAVGVSCETKALGEWVRFTCFKKTGTGGKPKRAVLPALGLAGETTITLDGVDGGAGTPMREIVAQESGMLVFEVPWKAGYKADGFIEWTDTKYLLKVDGASAKLAWDVTVQLRKTCAELERARDRIVGDAVKAGTVTDGEAKKVPKFGRCQPAGWGSWAVGVTALTRAGEAPKAAEPAKPADPAKPAEPPKKSWVKTAPKAPEAAKPMVEAALEMIWVDMAGKTTRAPMGSLVFVADKLQLPRIVAYDYDDDGRDEAVVLYELNGFTSDAAPKAVAPIWAFDGKAVAAYAKAPGLLAGSLFTEQLDSDMRPDLGHFGPYVAWPSRCGEATCPDRLTGPKLFAHSRADGTFSLDDDAARAAGKRMCSSRPSPVVAGKTNVARTALNVGCAKLWGVSADELTAELRAAAPTLCGAEADCELLKTLVAWAAIKPPFEIK